jgi:protein-S-isoprenylcysteine O-methyltransferase Ste14
MSPTDTFGAITMQNVTTQTQAPDHPDVVIFPPLILAAALALGCLLQALSPLGWLSGLGQDVRIAAGIVIAVIGVGIAASGRRLLVRAGTNVSPLQPTTALATGGIFRWTRNPLYTGGTLVMLGVAVVFALDWLVLLIIPSVLVLHFGVVRREEQYLEQKFGDAYRQYKSSVARYGFI